MSTAMRGFLTPEEARQEGRLSGCRAVGSARLIGYDPDYDDLFLAYQQLDHRSAYLLANRATSASDQDLRSFVDFLTGNYVRRGPDTRGASEMDQTERLDRIEAILRAHRLHEPSCPQYTAPRGQSAGPRPAVYQVPSSAPCDCWLAVDQEGRS